MSNQETEKPSEPRERWVDMNAFMQMQSKREDEKLLEVWKKRRDDAKKKKPKPPTGLSKG